MKTLHFLIAGSIWCGVLLSFNCYGQRETFKIPLGAMPMQFNGSFAGETGAPRISSIFTIGNTGANLDPHYENIYSIHTSFDTYIPSLRSGVGATAGYGGANSSFYTEGSTNFLSVAFAPKFSFRGKYTLSPSIDVSHFSVNYTPRHYPVRIYEKAEIREFLRTRIGLLFNTQKFYFGYVVNLSGNPDINSFLSWLQLGYTFQKNPESKFCFTPQVVFPITDQIFKLMAGEEYVNLSAPMFNFNFRYAHYIWGINNAGLHIGYQKEKLRLMAGSNFGVSLAEDYDKKFTGQLALRYTFANSDQDWNPGRF